MKIYPLFKKLVNYSEKIGEGNAFIPSITEMRRALDHLMGFMAIKHGFVDNPAGDHCKSCTELKKVIANLEGATKNLMDYINVNQKDQLDNTIKNISSKIVNEICPYIHNEIYPDIYRLQKDLEDLNKDLEKRDLDKLYATIERIFSIRDSLIVVEQSRTKLENEQKALDEKIAENNRSKKADDRRNIYISIIAAAIAACIGAIVGALFVIYSK